MLDINYVRNNAKNLEKENKELNEKINVYIRKNERLQQQLSKQEKRWNDEIELIEEPKEVELPKELKLKDFEGLSCYELHEVFNNKMNEIISYLKAKEEGKK